MAQILDDNIREFIEESSDINLDVDLDYALSTNQNMANHEDSTDNNKLLTGGKTDFVSALLEL